MGSEVLCSVSHCNPLPSRCWSVRVPYCKCKFDWMVGRNGSERKPISCSCDVIWNPVLHSSGLTFQRKHHSVSLLLVSKVVITVSLPLNVMSTQVTCRLQSWLSVHELLALTSLLLVLDCWSLFYSLRFCSSRNADMIYYPRWDLNTHEFILKTCWISIHVWSRQPFTLMGTNTFYCFCTLC